MCVGVCVWVCGCVLAREEGTLFPVVYFFARHQYLP